MQYNTLNRAPVVHEFSQELKSDLVSKGLFFFSDSRIFPHDLRFKM